MISVIVSYYQTDKTLFDACMRSILSNVEADIEVIVVDDGSSVEYHPVCDFFLKDVRVRVFHLEHRGVSYARNYGIDVSRGEWVTFIDSDDLFENDWYNKLISRIHNKFYDIIIFNGFKDIDGRLLKNVFFVKENVDYGQDSALKNKLLASALSVGFFPRGFRNYYSLGSSCSKLYRNEFLKQNNLRFDDETTFAEDTLFSLNVYYQAQHIVYIDVYLYHYFLNLQSVTNKFRPNLSKEIEVFFAKIKQFLDSCSPVNESLLNAYYSRAFSEILRVMNQEFFNSKNPVSEAQKRKSFEYFVNNEPFKQALIETLHGKSGVKRQFIALLIKLKMYCTVI